MEVPALEVVAKQLAEGQALDMALKSGTKLGPYEVLAPLGAGGMGEVYRARDSKLNRDVALKILPAVFTMTPTAWPVSPEAQVLASLNHPNIGPLRAGRVEQSPRLRAGIGRGAHTRRSHHESAVPMEEALAIGRQIAEAMTYAHEKGVTHRDLKPANIKITPEGT